MPEIKFDVLIAGAGPAGAACAIALRGAGLSVAILDKASFPRDKICGDGLTVDVVNQLLLLSPELATAFGDFIDKSPVHSAKLFSPDRGHLNIPFFHHGKARSGYVCRRFDFDNLLVQHAKQSEHIHFFENHIIERVEVRTGCVALHSNRGTFEGQILIGADGAYSVVSRHLGTFKTERNHYSAGLRVYYENISFLDQEPCFEVHFLREVLPGYFWIFPLPDNKANVGIGMLSSAVSKKKINLKETMRQLITTDPEFSERFKHARPIETTKGHGLPLGSKKRKISGNRILLTGDAASLIDPFTGEGIGNAIRTGRIAAEHVVKCFEQNDFSLTCNTAYDREVYRRMWKELRFSRALLQLCKYPRLLDFAVNKANNNKHVGRWLISP